MDDTDITTPSELQVLLDERNQAAYKIVQQHKFLEANYPPKLATDTSENTYTVNNGSKHTA